MFTECYLNKNIPKPIATTVKTKGHYDNSTSDCSSVTINQDVNSILNESVSSQIGRLSRWFVFVSLISVCNNDAFVPWDQFLEHLFLTVIHVRSPCSYSDVSVFTSRSCLRSCFVDRMSPDIQLCLAIPR